MKKVTEKNYLDAKNISAAMGESNDCSVIALSLACSKTYKQAHAVMAGLGRAKGGPAKTVDILEAVGKLGCVATKINQRELIEANYPKAHHILKHVSTHHPARFNKFWKNGNSYLLFVKGHVLAIVDGQTLDWTAKNQKQGQALYQIAKA